MNKSSKCTQKTIKTSEIMKDFVEFSPTEKLMFDLGNLTCFDAIGAVRKLPRID
jgi:uncharacterized protein involved in propanediol utilization